MKRDPKSRPAPSVSKLLRVLVAGGVALAGVAAPAAGLADDQGAPEKSDPATAPKGGAPAADQAKAGKPAPGQGGEKKEEKKKGPAAGDDAGGVKGW